MKAVQYAYNNLSKTLLLNTLIVDTYFMKHVLSYGLESNIAVLCVGKFSLSKKSQNMKKNLNKK